VLIVYIYLGAFFSIFRKNYVFYVIVYKHFPVSRLGMIV